MIEKKSSGITEKKYWDSLYGNDSDGKTITSQYKTDYKQLCDKLIMDKIIEFYSGDNFLEVGAGNSDWMIRVCKEFSPSYCAGLDYSEQGCELLKNKAKKNNVKIDVINADIFSPPTETLNKFDFIMSYGVVEHFKDLPNVLKTISRFSKANGLMFTLIPNMSGVIGSLTRLLDEDIYNIHVPHDLASFEKGHHDAGLDIVWKGYLGSSNFGVLSSCFQEQKGIKYFLYKQLTRVSKVIWLFETKLGFSFKSKLFSPYILVVSRVLK